MIGMMIRARHAFPSLIRASGVLLALLMVLPGTGVLRAAPPAQTAPVTLTARAGFDGYYKEQHWLPVRITVGNDGPDLTGSLQVSMVRGAGAEVVVSRQVDLP